MKLLRSGTRTEVSEFGKFAATGYEIMERFKVPKGELKLVLAKPESWTLSLFRFQQRKLVGPIRFECTSPASISLWLVMRRMERSLRC